MRPYNNRIEGMMEEESLQWLYKTALEMTSIIEIGCWVGRSTYPLLCGCKGLVYAIDHFKGSAEHQEAIKVRNLDLYKLFTKNLFGFKNLRTFKMTSEEAAKNSEIPEGVDMVFIDGSHDYNSVMLDLTLWYPRTKKLICGHDIYEEGVPKALETFFKCELEPVAGSIWAVWL